MFLWADPKYKIVDTSEFKELLRKKGAIFLQSVGVPPAVINYCLLGNDLAYRTRKWRKRTCLIALSSNSVWEEDQLSQ